MSVCVRSEKARVLTVKHGSCVCVDLQRHRVFITGTTAPPPPETQHHVSFNRGKNI